MHPIIGARQLLGKNVIAAMNTRATTEGLFDPTFSVLFVLYQTK
jgi:hypothetical protein